jgi:hypothetical protein
MSRIYSERTDLMVRIFDADKCNIYSMFIKISLDLNKHFFLFTTKRNVIFQFKVMSDQ